MKFEETGLEKLFIVEPEPFYDDRGSFFRVFCENEFSSIGLNRQFVQINQSINTKKFTFRGLHYQLNPYADCKLIRCIKGEVFDVIVDVRKNSKTFLNHFSIRLSSKNKKMLFVPEGFAHGFLTLEDNSQLIYHHTSFYKPGFEGELNYRDPKLKIVLPNEVSVISEKDENIAFIDNSFKGI